MFRLFGRFRDQLAEKEASDRGFGLLAGGAFLALSIFRSFRNGQAWWWAIALGVLLLITAWAKPLLLRRPKRAWLFLGFVLGLVVNPVMLAVLFFVVITPAGFIGRIFGRDPLGLRPKSSSTTYWRDRDEPASDMRLQF